MERNVDRSTTHNRRQNFLLQQPPADGVPFASNTGMWTEASREHIKSVLVVQLHVSFLNGLQEDSEDSRGASIIIPAHGSNVTSLRIFRSAWGGNSSQHKQRRTERSG